MNQHPHLKTLHTLYTEEAQPFRKVHRMIDLFESIIKSHTVVIIAEYVKHNLLSDTAKGLLAQGLRTPSLGTWQLFSRVLFEELQAVNYAWTINEFASGFEFLDKSLNNDKTNVIAFRNGYAHGATPSDDQCENDIRKFEPYLDKLLSLSWIEQSSIEVNDGIVYVQSEANSLCCHPIFLFRDENNEASFAFFNDLKNDKIGLLNYPLGKHYREKEFFKVFHEYLPLNEWKKSGNNEFYQRIEELTETFKGRTFEREKLLQFVINESKGYCSIQGNPGIGKSALIAQFFKDLRANEKVKNVNVVEYFIRRGTAQAQTEYLLNYLIKRTDELFPQGKEVRAEGKMVFEIQQQLFNKWRLWAEHSNGKKLLFLIDGLDEGVENNIISFLPRENFQDILIIYGSRPGGHKTIDELWATLPIESHAKIELSGLSKEDIRALIYEVANKYDLERESEWIEVVQQRSQGNPLYLKLLCDSIENGGIALNDLNALPSKIDDYYKAILLRYAQDPDGDALLSGLYTFAAAKDYLTMAHLGLMNQLGDATLERIGSTLKEVLYENPLTENILDYQLFHESFREYLIKEKTLKVNEAKQRIIEFCGRWKEFEGQWEQRYVLEHYASHLHESIKEHHSELLLKLIYDTDFQTTQKKVLRGFEATNALFRLAMLKASDIKRFDEQLEAGLCLVDLKYEEANDAPQIVAMVANGEIDLALKRIESFGGSDKEGIQRKFILYMLCLMELTLLESKDKLFRKDAIQKLLNHLDEQIPTDTSLINWNDFFPSYLMFHMAFRLQELGVDYLILCRRSSNWKKDWLAEKGPYSGLQFEVLLECARGISDESAKSSALNDISAELAKQGQVDEAASAMQEALACVHRINDESVKSLALKNIGNELSKQGKVKEASYLLQEAFVFAMEIVVDYKRINALKDISGEFANLGKVEEASSALEEALVCARSISDYDSRSSALRSIPFELVKQGKIEEALGCARSIIDEYWKSGALQSISGGLAQEGKAKEAYSVLEEALACARTISDDYSRSSALLSISTELAKQEKVDEATSLMWEAISLAQGINDFEWKNNALSSISVELTKQGNIVEASAIARGLSDDYSKSSTLEFISGELAKQGKFEEALLCAQGISDELDKSLALETISRELVTWGNNKEALACARGMSSDNIKSRSLQFISGELAKQGKFEASSYIMQESLASRRKSSLRERRESEGRTLLTISRELAKQGKIVEAHAMAQGVSEDFWKSRALQSISGELARQGKFEEASFAIQEALTLARVVNRERSKSIALKFISEELAQQGKIEEASLIIQEALTCARGLWVETEKSSALKFISEGLAKQGNAEEALSVMREALACALEIINEFDKNEVLNEISIGLAQQLNFEEALACARDISDELDKSLALKSISGELAKQGKIEEASLIIQEALTCARGLWDELEKSRALESISGELAEQGKIKESLLCARGISGEKGTSGALKSISVVLAKKGNLDLAESIGLEIIQLAERHNCWRSMAQVAYKETNWQKSIQQITQFIGDEARLFYLKGWANAVIECDADSDCVQEALIQLAHDSDSIEKLIQKHALHEVFFRKSSPEIINRFNRTIDIQWALDIIAQFPKEESSSRLSTNLETWLHEIADEDDRDQIELWAKQVAKGKITEEQFGERVKELM